jgi:site-specific DNA-methyltransferase (adenine-specific)
MPLNTNGGIYKKNETANKTNEAIVNMDLNRIYLGDCLELMNDIPDGSIDMILCDLPYGTTQNKWDIIIPFPELWEQYSRVIKENGAIILTGQQPFTTDLINSNRRIFRYEIIWEKTLPLGFLNAKKMPLRAHENILVFYKKLPTYNPIKVTIKTDQLNRIKVSGTEYEGYSPYQKKGWEWTETGERMPKSVIKISNWHGALFGNNSNATKHPTQKPVPLFEYLIKTYTNEGETVLDNCSGSGTTAIACIRNKRNYICIEKNEIYFGNSLKRIENEPYRLF